MEVIDVENTPWQNASGKYGKKKKNFQKNNELPTFEPCFHKGPCGDENSECPCWVGRHICEKFCCCNEMCKIQFNGCNCKKGCSRSDSKTKCSCILNSRECDPDLCKCQCTSHPLENELSCQNTMVTFGVNRRLLLGKS